MLKLDNTLLNDLGLGSLPDDQKKEMLQHIYETLELRVGTQLANQMSDQQLEEFEKFIDDGGEGNQAQALQWLETNLPNYKQVVNDVFEALKGEIGQMAPQIVAASGAQPQIEQSQGDPNTYQQPPVEPNASQQPLGNPGVYQQPQPQQPTIPQYPPQQPPVS